MTDKVALGMRRSQVIQWSLGIVFALGSLGCADQVAYRGRVVGHAPHTPPPGAAGDPSMTAATSADIRALTDPYLKCHLWDGTVFVLENYRVVQAKPDASKPNASMPDASKPDASKTNASMPSASNVPVEFVEGDGIKYDSTRAFVERGHFSIPIAQVALFESNRPESVASARVPVMATVTIASAALTALCIAAPKACFGSCPTIYAPSAQGPLLQAEGFSSSIAKRLESTDVDALSLVPAVWQNPQLEVTNEAPETHSIASLTLLAANKPLNGQVFRSGSKYFSTSEVRVPIHCTAAKGDCLSAVLARDPQEYKSDTDGEDLTHREELFLEFDAPAIGQLGLVVTARNTLLNSYLFYQALAYMGSDVGQYLALLERGRLPALSGSQKIGDLLGGIDIAVADKNGNWLPSGQYFEVGPLAKETEMFEVPALAATPLRVRLTMAKGNMRLDQIGLVTVFGETIPERLDPERVEHNGGDDSDALSRLRSPERYLVTYPGDAYTVHYPKARCESCAWFVESRGYYYEWMRDVWLPEQDAGRLMRLLYSPSEALRELAPAYLKLEPTIDQLFWQSHIEPRRNAAGALP